MSAKIETSNEFKAKIYACDCAACQAIESLVEDSGARLRFIPHSAGRLCELAVVAAAGNAGLPEHQVVSERRRYAEHIGVMLKGPISNADWPNHIHHALNPEASNPIRLGTAKAFFTNGHYLIKR